MITHGVMSIQFPRPSRAAELGVVGDLRRRLSVVTQGEFEATLAEFDRMEPSRSPLYGMASTC